MIPDRQGPTKLKRVFCCDYEIFSFLYISFITEWPALIILQWQLLFTAAVWLELGLSHTSEFTVWAAYSFVTLATSQIWSCNVWLHMLIFKLCSFMSSTAVTPNEFYFALSTFQISGKQIHDMGVVLDWVLTRSLRGTIYFVIENSSMGWANSVVFFWNSEDMEMAT